MEKKIGIINRHAPHGSAQGRESLDLALALSAYNESLTLFFIGDGVYQLLKGQAPQEILHKHYQPLFKMLALYDVEQIYICSASLEQRCLTSADLLIEASVLNTAQLQAKLAEQEQLLSF